VNDRPMTNQQGLARIAAIALIAAAMVLLLSGLVGIAIGGISAQAGWWLVVAGLVGLVLVAIELRRR
jgi:hypothetical protein